MALKHDKKKHFILFTTVIICFLFLQLTMRNDHFVNGLQSDTPNNIILNSETISMWPQPQIIKNENSKINLNFNNLCLDKSAIVGNDWISQLGFNNCVKLSIKRLMKVNNPCQLSILETSEKYEIWLNGNYTTIQADSIFGLLRGFQTLSQILDQANTISKSNNNAQVSISPIYILDYPSYPYRGLMLDIARHFISLESLKRHIDAMELVKMNAFHLHITDDESFSINIAQFDGQSKFNTGQLTMNILKELTDYCTERGIQLIPEVDTPSHSKSWSKAYPSIMYPTCSNTLDMSKDETYQVVKNVYNFIFTFMNGTSTNDENVKFSNKLLHTGADEIDASCFTNEQTYRNYQSFILNHVLQNGSGFLTGFSNTNFKIFPIVWADDLITDRKIGNNTNVLPRDTILQIWRNEQVLSETLKYYYKTIVSISEPWYLDAPCSRTFEKIYQYKPPIHPSIIGGETCMWTSASDTDKGLEEIVWPRAAAISERLWTNPCNPISFWNSTFLYNNGLNKMNRKKILISKLEKTKLGPQTWECSSPAPSYPLLSNNNCPQVGVNFIIPEQPSILIVMHRFHILLQ
ncbi:hypothetical protein ABK040_015722 [Willaertia magna]